MNIIRKSSVALLSFVIFASACELRGEGVVPAPVMNPAVSPGTYGVAPVTAKTVYVNDHGKSLTTPVAWGSAYGSFFIGAGATSRAPYAPNGPAFSNNVGDGAVAFGLGIGNPVDNLGLQGVLTQYDVSGFNRWGMSFQVSRELSSYQAIAVGVQDIFLSKGSDISESYYIVYSQGVNAKPFINTTTGNSKLYYSIGVGSGIYGNKSTSDIADGKGAHGTYVFGSVAYELFSEFNVITDWNGTNLNAGISKTFFITKSFPVSITAGLADLTGYSGDGTRVIVGVGTGITL